jgi:hypothetical protein
MLFPKIALGILTNQQLHGAEFLLRGQEVLRLSEICSILYNPKFCYCVRRSTICPYSELDGSRSHSPILFYIDFNIILPSMLGFSKQFLSLGLYSCWWFRMCCACAELGLLVLMSLMCSL